MPIGRANPLVEILLIEDTLDDALLMTDALQEGSLQVRVTLVDNGEDAILCLRRAGEFSDAPRPDLILLDLYLPRMNGHEVLAEIKQDSALRRIPIVILTATENESAILKAYDLHANCCVAKPTDLEQFTLTVKKIEQFWLRHARCE